MSTTQWTIPDRMIRGSVVGVKDTDNVENLNTVGCWTKVVEICKALANSGEQIQIVSEIWPDTGRIVWILKDRREFCRLELTAFEIEREYFRILNTKSFESEYDSLVDKLKRSVRTGFDATDLSFATIVIMRDSDSQESDEILFPGY